MRTEAFYTEIVLAELAHLTTEAGGDPRFLDSALGTTTYFERDDVQEAGRQIAEVRRRVLDGVTAGAAVDDYFAAVGALLATCPTALVVNTSHGRNAVYFQGDDAYVEIALVDERAFLTVQPGDLDLQEPKPGQVIAAYQRDGDRRFLAFGPDNTAAFSDDGKHWRTEASSSNRDPDEVLRRFVGR